MNPKTQDDNLETSSLPIWCESFIWLCGGNWPISMRIYYWRIGGEQTHKHLLSHKATHRVLSDRPDNLHLPTKEFLYQKVVGAHWELDPIRLLIVRLWGAKNCSTIQIYLYSSVTFFYLWLFFTFDFWLLYDHLTGFNKVKRHVQVTRWLAM